MEFIRNLWNKVKSFFGNLFGGKPVEQVQYTAPVMQTAPVAEVVTSTEAESTADQTALKEKIHALFNRIMELVRQRNYKPDEAVAAANAGDVDNLTRIERQMRNKSYKAPKASKLASLYPKAA